MKYNKIYELNNNYYYFLNDKIDDYIFLDFENNDNNIVITNANEIIEKIAKLMNIDIKDKENKRIIVNSIDKLAGILYKYMNTDPKFLDYDIFDLDYITAEDIDIDKFLKFIKENENIDMYNYFKNMDKKEFESILNIILNNLNILSEESIADLKEFTKDGLFIINKEYEDDFGNKDIRFEYIDDPEAIRFVFSNNPKFIVYKNTNGEYITADLDEIQEKKCYSILETDKNIYYKIIGEDKILSYNKDYKHIFDEFKEKEFKEFLKENYNIDNIRIKDFVKENNEKIDDLELKDYGLIDINNMNEIEDLYIKDTNLVSLNNNNFIGEIEINNVNKAEINNNGGLLEGIVDNIYINKVNDLKIKNDSNIKEIDIENVNNLELDFTFTNINDLENFFEKLNKEYKLNNINNLKIDLEIIRELDEEDLKKLNKLLKKYKNVLKNLASKNVILNINNEIINIRGNNLKETESFKI